MSNDRVLVPEDIERAKTSPGPVWGTSLGGDWRITVSLLCISHEALRAELDATRARLSAVEAAAGAAPIGNETLFEFSERYRRDFLRAYFPPDSNAHWGDISVVVGARLRAAEQERDAMKLALAEWLGEERT
jgi:hypothetical protein